MFESLNEWFAVQSRKNKNDVWAGWLKFSEEDGVELEVICPTDGAKSGEAPSCENGVITGYLDYQRPTTVIDPIIQSHFGGSVGPDTPVMRSKWRIMAGAIVKNVHLKEKDEKCFTSLHIDMPAFSSWYSPRLVKQRYTPTKDHSGPELSVDVEQSTREEFALDDGTKAIIHCFTAASEEQDTTRIAPRTLLTLELTEAVPYSAIQELVWRINTLFSFMLGHRMAQNPYRLKTTHCREWNGENRPITAELIFQPAFRSEKHHVKWHDALFLRHNCALSLEALLNAACQQSDESMYLMSMVLLMERPDHLSAADFGELVGCIEDFDIRINGSGSSRELRLARKRLRKIIQENGSDEDVKAFDDLAKVQPNKFSLVERIDRLKDIWSESGFRAEFESSEVKQMRNHISHGRGVKLSPEDYERMVWLNYDLCALSRFHIFRSLGIGVEEIAAAFRGQPSRYMRYAPSTK